jgi:hypothetical protein
MYVCLLRRQKVEYLQAKFTAAKAALEAMDGADLSEVNSHSRCTLASNHVFEHLSQLLNCHLGSSVS